MAVFGGHLKMNVVARRVIRFWISKRLLQRRSILHSMWSFVYSMLPIVRPNTCNNQI